MKGLLTSIFTSISEFIKHNTTSIEHQSESTVLEKLKRKDLAINYAEKIIFLVDKTELAQQSKYKFYKNKFFKYNN